MPLLRAGFTLDDVGRMSEANDIRLLVSVIDEVRRQNDVTRLLAKLDMAEAFNAAFVGSQSGKQNQSSYARWQRNVEGRVMKLMGQEVGTLWDAPRKRSRRLGR